MYFITKSYSEMLDFLAHNDFGEEDIIEFENKYIIEVGNNKEIEYIDKERLVEELPESWDINA